MEVVKSHGCIGLTGLAIEHLAAKALSFLHGMPATVSASAQQPAVEPDDYANELRPHMTLVTKEELAACTVSRTDLLQNFLCLDPAAFFPVGIAIMDIADRPQTHAVASSQSVIQSETHMSKSRVMGHTSSKQASTIAQMQPLIGKSSCSMCKHTRCKSTSSASLAKVNHTMLSSYRSCRPF